MNAGIFASNYFHKFSNIQQNNGEFSGIVCDSYYIYIMTNDNRVKLTVMMFQILYNAIKSN